MVLIFSLALYFANANKASQPSGPRFSFPNGVSRAYPPRPRPTKSRFWYFSEESRDNFLLAEVDLESDAKEKKLYGSIPIWLEQFLIQLFANQAKTFSRIHHKRDGIR